MNSSLKGEKPANTHLSCGKKGLEWLLVMFVDNKGLKLLLVMCVDKKGLEWLLVMCVDKKDTKNFW